MPSNYALLANAWQGTTNNYDKSRHFMAVTASSHEVVSVQHETGLKTNAVLLYWNNAAYVLL